MKELIKPKKLCRGDTIATISISGGRAGDADMLERYQIGKKRLKEEWDLNVIETPHALMGNDYIAKNPEKRMEDLEWALKNPNVKALIANMGGDDSYRLLPYVDCQMIHDNPKIFMGFSDISTMHQVFTKAGVASFYGPNLLTPIAQPISLDPYTKNAIEKMLFCSEPFGEVLPCEAWTPIEWRNQPEEHKASSKRFDFLSFGKQKNKKVSQESSKDWIKWTQNTGYRVVNGSGKLKGRLNGGCCGPMQQIMGTSYFPTQDDFEDTILFLEIGIPYPNVPISGLHCIRAFAATGMFERSKGMICTDLSPEAEGLLKKVICDELGLVDYPILANVDFGHRTPMTILPFGMMTEVDYDNGKINILESAVTD